MSRAALPVGWNARIGKRWHRNIQDILHVTNKLMVNDAGGLGHSGVISERQDNS
jgi:hypothetical protein